MAFKLGGEKRGIKDAKIFKKKLEGNTLAEANMDGSMYVDPSVDLNSKLGKRVVKHEQAHIDQIQSGRAAYGDEWVMWEDKIYLRRQENGVDVIDGPNGKWPEGDANHPWEQEAMEAENE